ncbi:MAG: segregation/condensation protein A [Fusobacteria bacterium]|nr:segregation/condensation protein A [Fusobacteriota bacterium]
MIINIKLNNFEGPMDLLLHLLEKQEMEIYKINISKLIDDYLEYLKEIKEARLEIKVEFLLMASELLEIKAATILNKKEKKIKEENLEQRIYEYKMYKNISEIIKDMENEYCISFMKNGKAIERPETNEIDLSNITLEKLFQTAKEIFFKESEKKYVINYDTKYTIEESLEEIEKILKINSKIEFSKLLGENCSKLKIVTIFLAILELYKINTINIFQENEIIIELVG